MYAALEIFAILMAVFVPIFLPFIISAYLDYKKKTEIEFAKIRKEIDENSVEDMENELVDVKDRLAVLEKIVTDRGFEVERKISNL